jgi:hypothetical protein
MVLGNNTGGVIIPAATKIVALFIEMGQQIQNAADATGRVAAGMILAGPFQGPDKFVRRNIRRVSDG